MAVWDLHPGGNDPPWRKKMGAAVEPEVEEEEEEDFFNPEAAVVDTNPFPTELMTEDDAVAVAEAVVEETLETIVEEVAEAEPEPESEPELTYDSMTVTQLQDLLRERELTVSGVKAELVARLEADDAGPSEEAPAETVEVPSEEAASSDEMPEEGEVSESDGGTETQESN